MPKIEVSLPHNGSLLLSLCRRNDSPALDVALPLAELYSEGADGAARQLGKKILQTLAIWHGAAFAVPPFAAAPPDDQRPPGNFEAALILFDLSLQQQTAQHVAAIEALLRQAQADGQMAQREDFLLETWPALRARLDACLDSTAAQQN